MPHEKRSCNKPLKITISHVCDNLDFGPFSDSFAGAGLTIAVVLKNYLVNIENGSDKTITINPIKLLTQMKPGGLLNGQNNGKVPTYVGYFVPVANQGQCAVGQLSGNVPNLASFFAGNNGLGAPNTASVPCSFTYDYIPLVNYQQTQLAPGTSEQFIISVLFRIELGLFNGLLIKDIIASISFNPAISLTCSVGNQHCNNTFEQFAVAK
jgi:hypothetical protein